ncbi:MAG: hypothetical protein KAW89_00075, partial [Armatimonadetes bacterium]|nr:hypothetical protein [Armatimonadota bacterium]
APGMVGSAAALAANFKGDISVERVSYFSLDAGRIVAFEDTIIQKVNKTSSEGEVYRMSGEKISFEEDMDLYVTTVQPIIAGVVGGAATMGGGVAAGMPGGGVMPPAVPGGTPAMGGAGMARPGLGGPMMPGRPGMMPGGAMMPGGPGMMPGWGMPGAGMPGPGFMGGGGGVGMMQMKPPTKATLEITTEWYVFDTTAGISQYAVVSEEGEVGGAVIKVRPSEAFAHKYALGGAGAASKEGLTFAVDLNAHSFHRVGRYYMVKEHEEIVTTTREYLLSLGYIPE